MKHFILLFIFFLLGINQSYSQIKTSLSWDECSVSGVKFGYIYSVDQLIKVFGNPDGNYTWEATDAGKGHELRYDDGLVIRMNDHPDEIYPGIMCFLIESNKYTLKLYGTSLTVGDSIEKVKKMPNYTSMEPRSEGFYVFFFNGMVTDETVQICFDTHGIINLICIEARYY